MAPVSSTESCRKPLGDCQTLQLELYRSVGASAGASIGVREKTTLGRGRGGWCLRPVHIAMSGPTASGWAASADQIIHPDFTHRICHFLLLHEIPRSAASVNEGSWKCLWRTAAAPRLTKQASLLGKLFKRRRVRGGHGEAGVAVRAWPD
ncbi:hypothetical protein LX36DRAFT_313464 [Colletotrichum falcatum]|nr:hypothetical protein LX36DRAFT_313464 [Colletotrichum falcatum]